MLLILVFKTRNRLGSANTLWSIPKEQAEHSHNHCSKNQRNQRDFPSSSVQNSTHQPLLPAAHIQSTGSPGNVKMAHLPLGFTHWNLVPRANIPSSVTQQCFIRSKVHFSYTRGKKPSLKSSKGYQSGPRGYQRDKVC